MSKQVSCRALTLAPQPSGLKRFGERVRMSSKKGSRNEVGMNNQFEDTTLVQRAKAGDRDAYQALVEKYQNRAYHIAFGIVRSKEDAEDVVQESFVKAYLSLSRFRGQSAFYTWLYRIVYNMAIDFKRKVARRGGAPREFDEGSLNSEGLETSPLMGKVETPHGSLNRKEDARRIQQALAEISEEHRTVIMLREYDGLSYEDIARVVGISRGTVMSRLHYARKKLQAALSDLLTGEEPISDDSASKVEDPAVSSVEGTKQQVSVKQGTL